ncbi:lasso peptide biosynthesis B2 protein [Hazenella sp. IB182353]|uniref:lasso peptide biosynthesis B2 protein n=1 Tax=Polycladospora coralii TaxID=2771432 RepID=UPI00174796F2|nr:lasso peptide biosynthesis B2 protein [Polycladospora coralii]MBS7529532.1 lasso peptide biosynthesis B2 protein [Polycladospora coralii]
MIRTWFYLILASLIAKFLKVEHIRRYLDKKKKKCKESWTIEEAQGYQLKLSQAKKIMMSRSACLEESIALFLLATSYRKRVDWCVGVRLAPFSSHAWIEVQGNEIGESIEGYKKIFCV